jgi:hypothetical protein
MTAQLFEYQASPSELQHGMLVDLFQSLSYIYSQAGPEYEDKVTHCQLLAESPLLHKRPDIIFMRAHDLVDAFETNDNARFSRISGEIYQLSSIESSLRFSNYLEKDLGDDFTGMAEILFGNNYGPQPIIGIPEELFPSVHSNYEEALALVKEYHPIVASEIEAFWSTIYFAQSNDEPGCRGFGGVSSLLLWGSAFSNTKHYSSLMQAADFLVHEATHALLFALNRESPMVRNALEETYDSPLRSDPRPMDGIFHATLVCARVSEFYQILASRDTNLPIPRQDLEAMAILNAKRYHDGHSTIKKYGDINDLGLDLLSQADKTLAQF